MTTTGQAIREAMVNRDLVFLGKTTALAGGTDRLRDATYFQSTTLSTADEDDCWVRITSASNTDQGFISKVKRIDVTTGDIYCDPPFGTAIASGTTYELWRHGIRPDRVDRARDRFFTRRGSTWLLEPLSMLTDVSAWLADSTETVTQTALAFPNEWAPYSLLVNNNGVANGHADSPSYYVQPGQQYLLWCRVSARTGTASLRVRRITATAADITLQSHGNGPTFDGRGWVWGVFTFTIPSGCYEIQVWPGGASSSCVAEWAHIGLLNTQWNEYGLPAAVTSEHDVGNVYAYDVSAQSPQGALSREAFDDVNRERAGAGVKLVFPSGSPAAEGGPVFYQSRHRYAALQTTAQYLTAAGRVIGDAATTDCPLEYAEAGTTVVLLEGLVADHPELKGLLTIAEKDLNALERNYGPDPVIVQEHRNQGGIPLMRL